MRAGNALRRTHRERYGVAGRRTIERREDARGVAGGAASTWSDFGGIEEECKHPWESGASQCFECGVILRMRAREKDATVRRGVILRRKGVMRKVTRMRKRVTRRCGMRCRKPYQRWGMKITTRPFFAQGLKRHDPLHRHHPERQCGLRMCLVYLYLLVSMCTTPSIR